MRNLAPLLSLALASVASPSTAQTTPSPTAGAPTVDATTAPDLPEDFAPPDEASDPLVGALIDGATILGITSGRRLPDGRPSAEACGYERDVVVEVPVVRQAGEAGPPTRVERAVLRFPCVKDPSGLVAGAPMLVLVNVAPPPDFAPDVDEGVGPDTLAPDLKDSKSGANRSVSTTKAPFAPVAEAGVGKRARLIEGFHRAQGPLLDGEARVHGFVILDVDVQKDGHVNDVRIVKGAHPRLDEESVKAARGFLYQPALGVRPVDDTANDATDTSGPPVDSVARLEIEWTTEPVPEEQRRVLSEDDMILVEGVFRKGELANVGRVQLVQSASSVGVGLGAAVINNEVYLQLRPNLDLHYGAFGAGLGAPFRLELLDFNGVSVLQTDTYETLTKDAGRFRIEDWDRLFTMPYSDWIRPVRYLSWGRKEDKVFVDVNRVNPITIGHGQLVRRYAPNADIDESNLFAEVDAYADFGGIEAMVGPLPIPRLAGGLVFVKPLGLFMDDYVSKSLSFGASYVTDLNAPTALLKSTNPATGKTQLTVDSLRFLYPERDQVIGRRVQGVGVDGEVKAVKWENVDVKLYGDYSHLIFPDVPEANIAAFNGGGATAGALLRLSFGQRPVRDFVDENDDVRSGRTPREMVARHAARFRAEGRVFSPQYLPSYWNPLYEIDKFQFSNGLVDENDRAGLPTKVEFLAGQANEPWRYGYYLEASYSWVDVLNVAAIYEDAWKMGGDFLDVPAGKNVIVHAETEALDLFKLIWLQAFATYHYRNFGLQDWIRLGQFTTDNEVLFVGGRLQILFLSFNLALQRGYRVAFLEEDFASLRPIESNGVPYSHTSVGYRSQYNFSFDVELGWTW